MQLPTDRQIRALHEKYAPTHDAFELVHTHCEIVCTVAEQLAARCGLTVDIELVRVGSLLHDIGVYRQYGPSGEIDHTTYVRHGVLGHELLRGLGFPEAVCRFCSCHTGVGISRADILAQGLPLPVADYLPESVEEELVSYADKFHSKTMPPVFVTADSYAAQVRRFGQDKAARFAAMRDRYGEPDLGPLAAGYGHAVKLTAQSAIASPPAGRA
ncbi:MAG TPA: HDIG domain-containing protein [Kineosporiaceae bacterium]|nr:HDIG domain-containing protein [Kineosporiaceae bacterium]